MYRGDLVLMGFDTVLEDCEFEMLLNLQVCEDVSIQIEIFTSVKDKTWGYGEYQLLPSCLLH
jgi:hypothetical protein